MARPSTAEDNGIPVDSEGRAAANPTKNVLDLVLAAVLRLDDLRVALEKRQDDLREALDSRVSELNRQRDGFDTRIEILKTSHQTQLEAVKSDFGKQIAAILAQQTEKSATLLSAQVAATTERLAVVEKNQYVSGGQSAVRDPAIADMLSNIQATISKLSKTGDTEGGSRLGQAQVGSLVNTVILIVIGIAAIGMPIFMRP